MDEIKNNGVYKDMLMIWASPKTISGGNVLFSKEDVSSVFMVVLLVCSIIMYEL